METILTAFLFVLSCNLDTLILAYRHALRGVPLSPVPALAVAGITSAVTGLSLALGNLAAGPLGGAASRLGALVLVGIGLWTLLDWLRVPAPAQEVRAGGCIPLAAALAVNNAGAGAAAGVSGLSTLWCTATNFAVTLLFLFLGRTLASRTGVCRLGRYALPLSGALLVLLGLIQL